MSRTVPLALALLLAGACTPECRSGIDCPEGPKAAPQPTVSQPEANTYFAMFMNDPTNGESWRWLCRAAAGGHTAAQYTVAVRYRDGMPPVAQSLPRAFLWFTAAQDSGLTAAAIAREEMTKKMTEEQKLHMRALRKAATEADCTEGRG